MSNKKAQTQTITVNVNQENAPDLDLLADQIIEVSQAFKKIVNSKLKERTVLLLLQDATGVPMGTIKKILEAGPKLALNYTR